MAEPTDTAPYNTVFVDTSLDTHLVTIVSSSDTVSDLKKKILFEHPICFPEIGEIKIDALKVKRRGFYYHLLESMSVKSAFHGVNKSWFISVDASKVDDRSLNLTSGNVVAHVGTMENGLVGGVDCVTDGHSKQLPQADRLLLLPQDQHAMQIVPVNGNELDAYIQVHCDQYGVRDKDQKTDIEGGESKMRRSRKENITFVEDITLKESSKSESRLLEFSLEKEDGVHLHDDNVLREHTGNENVTAGPLASAFSDASEKSDTLGQHTEGEGKNIDNRNDTYKNHIVDMQVDMKDTSQSEPSAKKKRKIEIEKSKEDPLTDDRFFMSDSNKEAVDDPAMLLQPMEDEHKNTLPIEQVENAHLHSPSSSTVKRKKKKKSSILTNQEPSTIPSAETDARGEEMRIISKDLGKEPDALSAPGTIHAAGKELRDFEEEEMKIQKVGTSKLGDDEIEDGRKSSKKRRKAKKTIDLVSGGKCLSVPEHVVHEGHFNDKFTKEESNALSKKRKEASEVDAGNTYFLATDQEINDVIQNVVESVNKITETQASAENVDEKSRKKSKKKHGSDAKLLPELQTENEDVGCNASLLSTDNAKEVDSVLPLEPEKDAAPQNGVARTRLNSVEPLQVAPHQGNNEGRIQEDDISARNAKTGSENVDGKSRKKSKKKHGSDAKPLPELHTENEDVGRKAPALSTNNAKEVDFVSKMLELENAATHQNDIGSTQLNSIEPSQVASLKGNNEERSQEDDASARNAKTGSENDDGKSRKKSKKKHGSDAKLLPELQTGNEDVGHKAPALSIDNAKEVDFVSKMLEPENAATHQNDIGCTKLNSIELSQVASLKGSNEDRRQEDSTSTRNAKIGSENVDGKSRKKSKKKHGSDAKLLPELQTENEDVGHKAPALSIDNAKEVDFVSKMLEPENAATHQNDIGCTKLNSIEPSHVASLKGNNEERSQEDDTSARHAKTGSENVDGKSSKKSKKKLGSDTGSTQLNSIEPSQVASHKSNNEGRSQEDDVSASNAKAGSENLDGKSRKRSKKKLGSDTASTQLNSIEPAQVAPHKSNNEGRNQEDDIGARNAKMGSENVDGKSRKKSKKKHGSDAKHLPELQTENEDAGHNALTLSTYNTEEVNSVSKMLEPENNATVQNVTSSTWLKTVEPSQVPPHKGNNKGRSHQVDISVSDAKAGGAVDTGINFSDYFLSSQPDHEIVASADVHVDKLTVLKGADGELKAKKNKRKVDILPSPALSSSMLSSNENQQVGRKLQQASNSINTEFERLFPNSRNETDMPPKVSSDEVSTQPVKSNKLNSVLEEDRKLHDVNASGAVPYRKINKEPGAASKTSSLESFKNKISRAREDHPHEGHNHVRYKKKAFVANNGEAVKGSGLGNAIIGRPGSIFKNDSFVASSNEDGYDSSDSTARTPSEHSFSSDSSDHGSSADVNSAQNGSPSLKRSKGHGESKAKTLMPLAEILRSSSRYKKAKLTASQSQLEDSEINFVPESQPNS